MLPRPAGGYALAPSQLFTWRRDLRRAAQAGSIGSALPRAAEPFFVPAVIDPQSASVAPGPSPVVRKRRARRIREVAAVELEIDGVEVKIAQGADAKLIAAVITASSAFHPRVTRALAAFRTGYPDVELTLEEANTARLLEGLREGSVDAAFLRPADDDRDGLSVTMLEREPMFAVLPCSHPAAAAEGVQLSNLAEASLLLFPREIGPVLFDIVMNACRGAGFEPRLGQTTPQIASIVHLVAAGFGVAIVPQSMNQLGPADVVYKPFLGEGPRAPLAFAHSAQAPSQIALNLQAVVCATR